MPVLINYPAVSSKYSATVPAAGTTIISSTGATPYKNHKLFVQQRIINIIAYNLTPRNNMQYFTSDHHFWHANIIKFCKRPFLSVEEMNEVLIHNWNAAVSPEDEVYYLGDFSMAARPAEIYTSKLNGIKYLVPGNHDFCHSYHKKSRTPEGHARWIKHYQNWGWIVLSEQTTLFIPEIGNVNLCHHPYGKLDSEGDKYDKWRPHDNDDWLLCGHIHEKWKTMDKMINVGVDVWNFQPVPVVEIIKIIQSESQFSHNC